MRIQLGKSPVTDERLFNSLFSFVGKLLLTVATAGTLSFDSGRI